MFFHVSLSSTYSSHTSWFYCVHFLSLVHLYFCLLSLSNFNPYSVSRCAFVSFIFSPRAFCFIYTFFSLGSPLHLFLFCLFQFVLHVLFVRICLFLSLFLFLFALTLLCNFNSSCFNKFTFIKLDIFTFHPFFVIRSVSKIFFPLINYPILIHFNFFFFSIEPFFLIHSVFFLYDNFNVFPVFILL